MKVATLSSNMQRFEKAAEIFEEVSGCQSGDVCNNYCFHFGFAATQIGRNSLENTLLKYGAKDYFFKAALCQFCINSEAANVSYRIGFVCGPYPTSHPLSHITPPIPHHTPYPTSHPLSHITPPIPHHTPYPTSHPLSHITPPIPHHTPFPSPYLPSCPPIPPPFTGCHCEVLWHPPRV